MQNKKKVLMIAHFCDYGEENTNNRFNYLAYFLSQRGFDVELITSSFSHRDKKQRSICENVQKPYKTTLIYEPSYTKNISIKRLFYSHCAFANNLEKYLNEAGKIDIVYCAVPSINAAEVAARYAQKQGVPFVIDVQDLWPEAYRLIMKNDLIYRATTFPLKKRINRVYAAADAIVAVSDTYAERAKSENRKCKDSITVFLGTEAETFDKNVSGNQPLYKKDDNEFWLGYCGTLGHSYDLSAAMLAVHKLKEEGIENVRLIVIGSGPLENQLKETAKKLDIRCTFTGKLAYGLMCAQLCECDVAMNMIVKGAAQSIINKHADYAMAGLPVISTQENEEYRMLLRHYNCGISCEPDSVDQIAAAIKELMNNGKKRIEMGNNSRRMADERFNRSKTYSRIQEGIERIL